MTASLVMEAYYAMTYNTFNYVTASIALQTPQMQQALKTVHLHKLVSSAPTPSQAFIFGAISAPIQILTQRVANHIDGKTTQFSKSHREIYLVFSQLISFIIAFEATKKLTHHLGFSMKTNRSFMVIQLSMLLMHNFLINKAIAQQSRSK